MAMPPSYACMQCCVLFLFTRCTHTLGDSGAACYTPCKTENVPGQPLLRGKSHYRLMQHHGYPRCQDHIWTQHCPRNTPRTLFRSSDVLRCSALILGAMLDTAMFHLP
ncbi:hypothetical protein COO60DRAFT_87200 [Scenedesmus sp. NREL 46B-D3]|nr:hypothetical protein COO60DRAFT_87200 [Scenedesmus sp. NREL 46B-D3]